MTARATTEAHFNCLRERWRIAEARATDYRERLTARYGQPWFAKLAEWRKLWTLDERASLAERRFFDYLRAVSPRDWMASVPARWIRDQLTFTDATTRGQLSTVPPPAFGYQSGDVEHMLKACQTVAP